MKPDTCTVLALQCLKSIKKAPPDKREALRRRAKVWLMLARDKRRVEAQKH